jgi:hypothetical protein
LRKGSDVAHLQHRIGQQPSRDLLAPVRFDAVFRDEEIEILFEEQTDRFDLADPDHARRSDGYGRRRAFGGLEHRGPGEDERARHDDQGHSYNT